MNRSVSFTLSPQDFEAAFKLDMLERLKKRSFIAYMAFMWAAVLSLHFFTWYRYGEGIGQVILPLILIVIGGRVVTYYILLPWKARRVLKYQKYMRYPVTITWSENNFKMESQLGIWDVPWNDYCRLAQNSEVVLIYHSPQQFYTVPKRVLSDAQVEDFMVCARSIMA